MHREWSIYKFAFSLIINNLFRESSPTRINQYYGILYSILQDLELKKILK